MQALLKYFPRASKEILWSTGMLYLGKAIQILVGIVTVKLITTALGTDQYGFYGKITEYALFFSTVANLGIFSNVVRKMSENPSDGKLFINALALRFISALAILGLGATYALIFISDPLFQAGVLLFMGSLFVDYLSSICDGTLQAHYRMGRSTIAHTLGRLIKLGIVWFLFQQGVDNVVPFFLGPLAGSLLTFFIVLAFVRQKVDFKWQFDGSLIKSLFLTALPFGIISLTNNLYFRFLPSLATARILDNSGFGFYNLSLQITATLSLLSTFLMFSSLPAFKRALKKHDFKEARKLYSTLKKGLLFLGISMILVGSAIMPAIVRLLSGPEFYLPELWFVPVLLLILTAISFLYDLVLITLFALEKDLWFLKREGLALLASLPLLLLAFLPALSTPQSMIFILLAAIAGESSIVFLAARKIGLEINAHD